MIEYRPHLLASVYLSPTGLGLQTYKLGYAKNDNDSYFRIGRFLTGLASLRKIPWASISIHYDTDPEWNSIKPQISDCIRKMYPDCQHHDSRISFAHEWLEATINLRPDDVLYLHTNDDHAFVAESATELLTISERLHNHPELKLGAVTHFPEMIGMLARQQMRYRSITDSRTVDVNYAVGTTLVRVDFFREWWLPSLWARNELVVRPDNPLGNPVTFEHTKMIIPRREIIRHMDGYSHVGIAYPLPALRNTHTFDQASGSFVMRESWRSGHWPSPLYALHGSGVDYYRTASGVQDSEQIKFACAVAWLQSQWALRVCLRDGLNLLRSESILPLNLRIRAVLVALRDWRIGRNLLDKMLDFPIICLLSIFAGIFPSMNKIRSSIFYKGTMRTISSKIS